MTVTGGVWQNETESAFAKIGNGFLMARFNFGPCLFKTPLRQVTAYFPGSPTSLDTRSQFSSLSFLSSNS